MIKEALFTLLYLGLFNFLIYKFKRLQFKSYKPFVTFLLFNAKFVVGIFIWFIYTFYYKDVQNNDVHKFYTDALTLHEIREYNPQVFSDLMIFGSSFDKQNNVRKLKNWTRNFDEAPINENRTVIRLNALLMFVSFKTYFVHILFFCFFSLVGWVLLTNAILSFAPDRNAILALPVLFLPSVLFWTSGVMKEPLLVLGLGLLLSGILYFRLSWQPVVKVLAGFIIVLASKFFVLVCLAPGLIAFVLFGRKQNIAFVVAKYAVVTVLLLLVAFNMHYLVPRINLQQMLLNKQTHSVKEAIYAKAGSRIDIPVLEDNALSIAKVAFVGARNALFRPTLLESKNIMMALSAAENFIIIPFLLLFIFSTNWRSPHNLNLFLFLLTFSLAYFALVGMCTPVLGNLVRYRTPLTPVFMFAFIIKMDPKLVASTLGFVLREQTKT